MGKSNEMPTPPAHWTDIRPQVVPNRRDNPADTAGGWPDFTLPDGQKLKDVIQRHRSELLDTVERLQTYPESADGGLGYATGHYLSMAWPHGALDFKNRFKGRGNATDLGKAGNFAYYAIGAGILPDAVLDAGASAYNLYKTLTGQNMDHSNPFGPDKSAQTVRDHALTYGMRLK